MNQDPCEFIVQFDINKIITNAQCMSYEEEKRMVGNSKFGRINLKGRYSYNNMPLIEISTELTFESYFLAAPGLSNFMM